MNHSAKWCVDFSGNRNCLSLALRMGGGKAGKEVGEHLIESGISEDEAVKRVLHLLDYH